MQNICLNVCTIYPIPRRHFAWLLLYMKTALLFASVRSYRSHRYATPTILAPMSYWFVWSTWMKRLLCSTSRTRWQTCVHATLLEKFTVVQAAWCTTIQCESKKNPPGAVRGPDIFHFFTNGWEFLIDFLHTYYTFLFTLDYKFLFNYPRFWRSYGILSATT